MTKILVPSASYTFTDHLLSSEGISCYRIFQNLKPFNYHFEAVSALVRTKKPLENTTLHQTGHKEFLPTANLIDKYMSHIKFIIRSYQKSTQILKKQEIDIIHHMLPAVYNQTFSLLAILKRTKKPPFVFGPLSAHIYPRPLDEKTSQILTSHLHRKTIQKCDQLVTITHQVKKMYSNFFDEEKICVIPLGVDIDLFKPSDENTPKGDPELLFAGYLYKLKGVEFLIKAMPIVMEKYKNIKLRIIGNGPDKQPLQKLAETLKISKNVTFEGFAPHTQMPKYYQQCDIFCFPTLGEPFGKAIIEAMACAKPVVATNIGGSAEIIQNKKTGILIEPGRSDLLANEILDLLNDGKQMKTIGSNARKLVAQKYSWEKIAVTYHQLYSKLL